MRRLCIDLRPCSSTALLSCSAASAITTVCDDNVMTPILHDSVTIEMHVFHATSGHHSNPGNSLSDQQVSLLGAAPAAKVRAAAPASPRAPGRIWPVKSKLPITLGLANWYCARRGWRSGPINYSTSPRNGNRVNGNRLGIWLSFFQKNRNSLTWVLVALTVCLTYPVLYRVSAESRAGEWEL